MWRSRLHAGGLGCRFPSKLLGRGCRLGGGVGVGLASNGTPNVFGHIHRNRTGVGLLFRDSEARQKVDDGLGLDFQFAGQLIDSDLIRVAAHALRFGTPVLRKLRMRFVVFLFRRSRLALRHSFARRLCRGILSSLGCRPKSRLG